MNDTNTISRRKFIQTGAAAGGGLLLSFYLPAFGKGIKNAGIPAPTNFAPNAFVRIGKDNIITVIVNHSEMGQGAYTSLPMIIADELDADWSKVKFEAAPVDPVYNHPGFGMQGTGGSTSTWVEWDRFRNAGATGRHLLVAAAAQTWNVDPSTCRTEKGFVIHDATGRKLSYGELVDKAATITSPKEVKLKEAKDFKFIGKPIKRLDTPEKIDGSGIFGLDVKIPGLLTAVIARPPVFGGKVKSFNADKAKAIPGVKDVVQIDRSIAVVANGFWPAKLGREALEIVWDEGPLSTLDSKTQTQQYADLAKQTGAVAKKEGDVAAVKSKVVKNLDVVYDMPYLAHAPMEPLNCVADVKADSCEIWVGTQFQTVEAMTAAAITGLKPNQVKVHTTLLGGGFGRRAVPDGHFVSEAVQVSKAIKSPVKVVWTREDDIRGGYYRPRAYHTISAGLDAAGKPLYWKQSIVCQSFIVGTPFESFMIKDGVDAVAVEGANELPYHVPNHLLQWNMAPGGVPTLWWRSVGSSHTAFAVECFIDELAKAAGKDPFEYRRMLMDKHPRQKKVLEYVAQKAGWKNPLPAGRGKGIAVHESFGSVVAMVAEVSIAKNNLKVHKVTVAVDCGQVVNPDTIKAQMEGCVVFGLTAALYGEISFENGRVKQGNFHDYRMVRMNEMPVVEVHIMDSKEKMGGVGEPGVPPVAPAVMNALFTLTGKRVRKLPLQPDDLKKKV
ncbi:xanthine dehydrogenase family protein molybdopterin-binding subunit [Terrimonas pollutisoli]|uniref:xanthine dehydrogenase family protein molybdopterin-binding subunit n=1 Tax=Terrimonas pollutisoli TaxID=3034147 RepID=UPI0023EDA797|nr:xanthine dehydrogenase family protein molybdopterin-binding subunit [Terrimonas sp. H1YJ31]